MSDPLADAANNFLSGFVQSETSTAWCGDVALVGFNDSGSLLPSLTVGGLVFSGYSRSSDRGRTFTDMGFVPASNPDFELLGDPVMGCGSQKDFHYANLLVDGGALTTGVGVSTSADGGVSFAEPVKAIEKGLDLHFIDKEWMAVDPGNPNKLYVTYTDFDGSGDVCGFDAFGAVFRNGVELVKSLDGGQTWSAPVVIESACDPDGATGSQIVVDDDGTLYVAWEHFPAALPNNEIRLRKSTDGGTTFGPLVLVANTIPVGGNQGRQFLQGIVRIVESRAWHWTGPADPATGRSTWGGTTAASRPSRFCGLQRNLQLLGRPAGQVDRRRVHLWHTDAGQQGRRNGLHRSIHAGRGRRQERGRRGLLLRPPPRPLELPDRPTLLAIA